MIQTHFLGYIRRDIGCHVHTRAVSKYGHSPWVPSEGVDVPLNPLEGLDLVHEAIVPWGEGKCAKAGTKPPLHDLVNTTLTPRE